MYIQFYLTLFGLPFCIQSHKPCGRTSCRKYCHAADLEIIKIKLKKRQTHEYKNTENRILNSNKNIVEKTETSKMLEKLNSS